MFSVYGLADPDSGAVRYVGVTKQSILLRAIRHLADSVRRRRGLNASKIEWLHGLAETGRLPEAFLIEEFETAAAARSCEAALISALPGLLNMMVHGAVYTTPRERPCRKCQTPFLSTSAAAARCGDCCRKPPRSTVRGAAPAKTPPTVFTLECVCCAAAYSTLQPSQRTCSEMCRAEYRRRKARRKEKARRGRALDRLGHS